MEIRKQGGLFPLAAVALLLTVTRCVESSKDIDEYINGLSYDRDEILAYRGETVTAAPTTGKVDEKKTFIVIEKTKKTVSSATVDVGIIASNEHVTYPGNLLLANQRLVENTPDVLAIDRGIATYTVDLPGMTTDGSFNIEPSFSSYQSTANRVLDTWFQKYSKHYDVVANFQSDRSMAYSKELLRVKFGLDFKNSLIESGIDFSVMDKQDKLIMIHKFRQVFYTVSVEPTKRPSDLFGSNVTLDDVKKKTDSKNPPVLVDSVSYGRTIFVKIETTSTDEVAKFILENKLTMFNISYEEEMEYYKILKYLSMTIYVIGGSSKQIEVINTNKFREVNDIITKYVKFSRVNLGYPISYSTQFVKDNSRATVNRFTEYIETTRTEHASGIVEVVHKGWFVMQWQVLWQEISFDADGHRISTEKSWNRNWDDLTAPFWESIELPGNAEAISVFARLATGWVFNPWKVVINRSGIPLIKSRRFTVWGSTFYPDYNIDPPLTTLFKKPTHYFNFIIFNNVRVNNNYTTPYAFQM